MHRYQPQQQKQSEETQGQAAHANPSTPEAGPERQPRTNEPSDDSEQDSLPWFGAHNVAEWATFAITGIAILVAWRTLGILRDQTNATKTAANAASRSADAATMALTHAERAYINAQDWEATLGVGFGVFLKLAIKNSGRTPGNLLSTSWYATYSAHPPERPTADQLHRIHGLNSFVTPQDIIEVDLEVGPNVDMALFNALKDKTTYFWVYMEVSYTDVFQKDLTHWTRICRRLHKETMRLESAPEANYDYAD